MPCVALLLPAAVIMQWEGELFVMSYTARMSCLEVNSQKNALITNCEINKQGKKKAKINCNCHTVFGKLIHVTLSNYTAKCDISTNDNVQCNCVLLSIVACSEP